MLETFDQLPGHFIWELDGKQDQVLAIGRPNQTEKI
jgi:hypothetical protein